MSIDVYNVFLIFKMFSYYIDQKLLQKPLQQLSSVQFTARQATQRIKIFN